MKYTEFGNTGLKVSELCHGTLIFGPLQADVPVADAAPVIRASLEKGVNFLDTAEMYKTYPHIREALKGWPRDKWPVIASKSMARTADEMRQAVEEALWELGTERVDIFLFHSVDGRDQLEKDRAGAMDYLLKAKMQGKVGHIGISTHSVPGVAETVDMPEIEVILPIINKAGMGLRIGTMVQMMEAVKRAYDAGKAIYVMKALAGGHLREDARSAFNFIRGLPFVHAVAVGMKTLPELEADLAIFEDRQIPETAERIVGTDKRVKIIYACKGCGSCVEVCTSGAMKVVDGKAVCDHGKCILCGYCAQACPSFAIRLV